MKGSNLIEHLTTMDAMDCLEAWKALNRGNWPAAIPEKFRPDWWDKRPEFPHLDAHRINDRRHGFYCMIAPFLRSKCVQLRKKDRAGMSIIALIPFARAKTKIITVPGKITHWEWCKREERRIRRDPTRYAKVRVHENQCALFVDDVASAGRPAPGDRDHGIE